MGSLGGAGSKRAKPPIISRARCRRGAWLRCRIAAAWLRRRSGQPRHCLQVGGSANLACRRLDKANTPASASLQHATPPLTPPLHPLPRLFIQVVEGRALVVDPETKKLQLTMKKALLGSKLPPLADIRQVAPGVKAHGVITGARVARRSQGLGRMRRAGFYKSRLRTRPCHIARGILRTHQSRAGHHSSATAAAARQLQPAGGHCDQPPPPLPVPGIKDGFGLFVTFYNGLAGVARKRNLGLAAGQAMGEVYEVGQVVRMQVGGGGAKVVMSHGRSCGDGGGVGGRAGAAHAGAVWAGSVRSAVLPDRFPAPARALSGPASQP